MEFKGTAIENNCLECEATVLANVQFELLLPDETHSSAQRGRLRSAHKRIAVAETVSDRLPPWQTMYIVASEISTTWPKDFLHQLSVYHNI